MVQLFFDPFFLTPDETIIHYFSRSQYEIRLQSIFGYIGSNEVSYSFIPIISVLIGYYNANNKSFGLLWLFMAGVVFFGTKTRFIYLNYFIILLQYPLVTGLKIKNSIRILFLSLLASIVVLFVLQNIGFNIDEFIENRLLSKSASTRILAIEMFVKFFPNNPFLVLVFMLEKIF